MTFSNFQYLVHTYNIINFSSGFLGLKVSLDLSWSQWDSLALQTVLMGSNERKANFHTDDGQPLFTK